MKTPSGGFYPSPNKTPSGGMTDGSGAKGPGRGLYPKKRRGNWTGGGKGPGNGFYHPRGPLFGRGRKGY